MEFLSLVIVVVAAFLTPIIVNRLNINFLPVVVAEILMGIIIGNSFLNLVTKDSMLNILSTLGFIFLMFLSGLEIDFNAFKKDSRPRQGESKESAWAFKSSYVSFRFNHDCINHFSFCI